MSERGPIYGVELLGSLPLDGGVMRQALPSASDLRKVREVSERTVAGYEVLLEHYRRLQADVNRLRAFVAEQPCECYDDYGKRRPEPCERCRLFYRCESFEEMAKAAEAEAKEANDA